MLTIVNMLQNGVIQLIRTEQLCEVAILTNISDDSAVHYVIWRDLFVQIELGVKIANLGGE